MILFYLTPFFLFVTYLIYTRVVCFYISKSFYSNQGILIPQGAIPVLGHLPRFRELMSKASHKRTPWLMLMNEEHKDKIPGIHVIFHSFTPTLHINDPEILNELFVIKNKYFDKHPRFRNALFPLLGDTLTLLPSNENWKNKRKVVSTVFYKDKLSQMIPIVISTVSKSLMTWKNEYALTGKDFIVNE